MNNPTNTHLEALIRLGNWLFNTFDGKGDPKEHMGTYEREKNHLLEQDLIKTSDAGLADEAVYG